VLHIWDYNISGTDGQKGLTRSSGRKDRSLWVDRARGEFLLKKGKQKVPINPARKEMKKALPAEGEIRRGADNGGDC